MNASSYLLYYVLTVVQSYDGGMAEAPFCESHCMSTIL